MIMGQLRRPFIFGLVLALIFLSALHAQTATSAPAGANMKAESSTTTGQAPDEMTKKLTDLVHAGKYAEAEKLTEAIESHQAEARCCRARCGAHAHVDHLQIAICGPGKDVSLP